jgi:hypothetical protein
MGAAHDTIVGIFRTQAQAEAAREALLGTGLSAETMALAPVTGRDGVADEFPGQSYENQPGQDERENAAARFAESMRSGACTLTVFAGTRGERERIVSLLRERGAMQTVRAPA